MVMKQLGYEQTSVTTIYIDNLLALKTINENTAPTERCRHVDLRYWALQDWSHVDKSLIMAHCPGTINISDNQTKPLGYVLHARHCHQAMGHYGPS